MPTNWKYIKKQLEKEFLCEKLKGHITYDLTDYRPAPWYQQHFVMKYDDEVLFEARQVQHDWYKENNLPNCGYWASQMIAEKVYIKYKDEGIHKSTVSRMTYYIAKEVQAYMSHYQGFYGVEEIVDAIGVYLHSDIDKSIKSEEFFIQALAVLDRRCGKRRLQKNAAYEYTESPDWLKRIYQIRFEAEGIKYSKNYITKKEQNAEE